MRTEQYHRIRNHILSKLNSELSAALSYHGVHHTRDTLEQAVRIASAEKIRDQDALLILQTAVLYHDSGFLNTYSGHEEEGCRIAAAELPSFGVNSRELDQICHLILATRIPQNPSGILEEIICDADLDYLGRDDFFPIASTLFEELKRFGILDTEQEWNRLQLKFLEAHHYFTATARHTREALEQTHCEAIRKLVDSYG